MVCLNWRNTTDGRFYPLGHVESDPNERCDDESENSNEVCQSFQCLESEFRCPNRTIGHMCIPKRMVCDGTKDCFDGGDEEQDMCSTFQCPTGTVRCQNGSLCLKPQVVCDPMSASFSTSYQPRPVMWYNIHQNRRRQCIRELKETGICQSMTCYEDEYRCPNRTDGRICIPYSQVCTGNPHVLNGFTTDLNCADGADEAESLCTNFSCPENLFTCWNSSTAIGPKCLSFENVCGEYKSYSYYMQVQGCPNGEDRSLDYCRNFTCPDGMFSCRTRNGRCIHPRRLFDGVIDCNDGSDELLTKRELLELLELDLAPVISLADHMTLVDTDNSATTTTTTSTTTSSTTTTNNLTSLVYNKVNNYIRSNFGNFSDEQKSALRTFTEDLTNKITTNTSRILGVSSGSDPDNFHSNVSEQLRNGEIGQEQVTLVEYLLLKNHSISHSQLSA